jgi:hypothetical protein
MATQTGSVRGRPVTSRATAHVRTGADRPGPANFGARIPAEEAATIATATPRQRELKLH